MYVSNLSFHTTDEDLKSLFSDFGEVSSSKVITDRETGRSRGFGFVEMPEEADAKKAMEELDGKDIEGRALSVTVARPKEQRSGGGGGGSFSQNRKRW
ncbi:RNA recognition motif domain-containing protein [Agriterribacter sp.]|uniref:RNA recognition motif domain-containing protein n=1 Tax=Agriterribacter sp. TaxID=2821509 RepID=UPI002C306206|nr:RNA-binding protein [Agriterribacter sp.]